MKRHCVGQTFIVYWRKETTLQQTSNLFKLFSTSVKAKKQADEFLLFLNFIFHQLFYYVQLNYKLISTLHSALPFDFQVGVAMRFFKNESKKVVQGYGKKLVRSWEGAPKKMCFHSLKNKKMEAESKKMKNNDARRTSTWNEKVSYLCVCSKTHWCDTMSDNARNCLKDTTPDNWVFVFALFFLVLLQQVFYKLPANQIIISTYN